MGVAIPPVGRLSLTARGMLRKRVAVEPTGPSGRTEQIFTLTPPGRFLYTAANWGAVSWFLEVVMRATSSIALAQLYDVTSGAPVASSVISQDNRNSPQTAPVRVRSGALTLVDGHEYMVQFGNQDGGAGTYVEAQLIAV